MGINNSWQLYLVYIGVQNCTFYTRDQVEVGLPHPRSRIPYYFQLMDPHLIKAYLEVGVIE